MTEERSAEVLRHIPKLKSVAEAHAFRAQLAAQGEQLTTEVYRDLLARIDLLARREGKA